MMEWFVATIVIVAIIALFSLGSIKSIRRSVAELAKNERQLESNLKWLNAHRKEGEN